MHLSLPQKYALFDPFFFSIQSDLYVRFFTGITGFNLWHVIAFKLHMRLMGSYVSSHLSVMIMSFFPSHAFHPHGAYPSPQLPLK